MHFHFRGKGSKNRYVPVHPATSPVIGEYLEVAGHGDDRDGPMFRPINNNRCKVLRKALSPDAIYGILKRYCEIVGIGVEGVSPHALRATAATNALENKSDLKRVRDWLGHANVSTTTMYVGVLFKWPHYWPKTWPHGAFRFILLSSVCPLVT